MMAYGVRRRLPIKANAWVESEMNMRNSPVKIEWTLI